MRELRAEGKSASTINGVLKAARRVFKFAARRMGWFGMNPVDALDESERPRTSAGAKRRIYRGRELAQTIAAAHGRWRNLFIFAAVTGARLSECLGLRWTDLALDDLDAASVVISSQD